MGEMMTLNEATVILALDGHSLAAEAAHRMPFFLAVRVVQRLIQTGALAVHERTGGTLPSSTQVVIDACAVWRERVSVLRPSVIGAGVN
jgi:hypothetical protein